jgi:hypothetical protein
VHTHSISTGSGTLFGRASFFAPLRDTSESCFFFPMVDAAARGGEGGIGGVGGVGNGKDDVHRLL